MEVIIMLLAPLPIGFLVRHRLAAYLTYIAIHAFVFTFQTLALILEWVGGSKAAFGPYPKASHSQLWAYVAVNTAIYAVGLGLVTLGLRLGAKRRVKQANAVNLDAVRV